MTRRLLVALALSLTAAACGPWVPPPFTVHAHHAYCYGEGGHIDGCVSPGSAGGDR